MKILRYILLAAILIISLSSCGKQEPASGLPIPAQYRYLFAMSIKTASGNDILSPLYDDYVQRGFVLNPELYSYDIKTINPDEWTVRRYEGTRCRPYLQLAYDQEDKDYLLTSDYGNRIALGLQNPLTYSISFPAVFKDNIHHIIESYWEEPESPGRVRYAKCTKVTVDGKEVEVKEEVNKSVLYSSLDDFYYCIEIILDD